MIGEDKWWESRPGETDLTWQRRQRMMERIHLHDEAKVNTNPVLGPLEVGPFWDEQMRTNTAKLNQIDAGGLGWMDREVDWLAPEDRP